VDYFYTYANSGTVSNCASPSGTPQPVFNASYNQYTRATPTLPPGVQQNTYDWHDAFTESLIYDIFNTDVFRHLHLSYWFDTQVQNINVKRFTIISSDYLPNSEYGMLCTGLINPTCTGKNLMVGQPHNYRVDLSCVTSQTQVSMYTGITAPAGLAVLPTSLNVINDSTILFQTAQQLQSFDYALDPSVPLVAWQDLHPLSGQELRGSLKQQINLVVPFWVGASNQLSGAYLQGAPGQIFTMAPYDSHDVGIAGTNLIPNSNGMPRPFYWPLVWINKHGELTSKQADAVKAAEAAVTASRILLIVGTVIGGVMFIVGLILTIYFARRGDSYAPQTSKSDLQL